MVEEYLEEIRNSDDLKSYVIDYYIDNYKDSTMEELLSGMKDLMNYGCVSGLIPDLIYYEDTTKFYDKYKTNINEILSEFALPLEELFGDKFDADDPLILDISNKNLLAWFGFEITSNRIYDQLYEKVQENQYEYSY